MPDQRKDRAVDDGLCAHAFDINGISRDCVYSPYKFQAHGAPPPVKAKEEHDGERFALLDLILLGNSRRASHLVHKAMRLGDIRQVEKHHRPSIV